MREKKKKKQKTRSREDFINSVFFLKKKKKLIFWGYNKGIFYFILFFLIFFIYINLFKRLAGHGHGQGRRVWGGGWRVWGFGGQINPLVSSGNFGGEGGFFDPQIFKQIYSSEYVVKYCGIVILYIHMILYILLTN